MNFERSSAKTVFAVLFSGIVALTPASLIAQDVAAADGASLRMILRCDDIGMCHAVNMAFREVAASGLPVSASVMFACPWYQEAVEIFKQHPEVSVGVHLTLNAEWKNYRWGPVTGRESVPSLVDDEGFFFPSRALLFANSPKIGEIEKELRAQIERARRSGIRIDYLDYHMGAAVQTPELRRLVERLAREYTLGVSRWFGEEDVEGLYATPIDRKLDTALSSVRALSPGTMKLFVFHIGLDTPEMEAMLDLNTLGLPGMSRHRQAELEVITSPVFRQALTDRKIQLTTYRQLIDEIGLQRMKSPDDTGY